MSTPFGNARRNRSPWLWMLAAAVSLGAFGAGAKAQPAATKPAPAEKGPAAGFLPERPLQDALNEATGRNRLLVVVTSPSREKEKANQALWTNPALQQWIAWHGVLVHVKDNETLKTLREAGLIVGVADQPLLFRAGKQERIFGSIVRDDNHQPGGVRLRPAPAPKDAKPATGAASDRPDTSVRLLLRLEWTLRGFRASDPAWWSAHNAGNPAPEAPGVPYAFRGIKDRADPALGEEGMSDPAGRLLGVLKSVAEKGDAAATEQRLEMCTWLWERSCENAPAFEGVRLTTLAHLWHELCERDPAAKTRVQRMIDAEAALLPWADDRRWFAWLMLKRVADEHLDALDFIDASLDDPDGKTMLSTADRGAWEMMLPWLNWADPATLPGADGDGVRLLKELKNRRGVKRPAKADGEEWDRLQGLADWLIKAQGSRVYAALLLRGKAADASAAAKMVIDESPADGALWLAAAAVCEGQGREEQLAWLGGVKDAWAAKLAGHVKAEIEAAAKK